MAQATRDAGAAAPDGRTIEALETRPLFRNLALSRLGVGVGLRVGGHLLANAFRGERGRAAADRTFYAEQAAALTSELGRLKGSVMKAGQLLALVGQQFLPPEAIAALAELHELSRPVAWHTLAPSLARAIGRERLAELEVDETPIGAASLGQVHRARRRTDGAQLALKIQYPGVADAIDSDVLTLQRLLMLSRLAPRDLDLTPTFGELKRLLRQEADYAPEARFTQEYAQRLAGDPRFIVPRVYAEYSSPHVLAMSYEEGPGVLDASVQALPLARRNRLALALIELFLREFFDWGMVQSDPNFGNFRFRLDPAGEDRIVLLDFGATRRYSARFVASYRDIVAGALLRNRDRIVRGSIDLSMLRPDLPEAIYDGYARAKPLSSRSTTTPARARRAGC